MINPLFLDIDDILIHKKMNEELKTIQNKTKEEIMIENLRDVKEIFDKHNIEFWLDCGTLLGAVRDQKFISWDSDIDFGTWEKDTAKIVLACRKLQSKNFEIDLGRNEIVLKRKVSFIPISILSYRLSNGKAVNAWGRYKSNRFIRRFINIFFFLFLTPSYIGINPIGISGFKNFIRLSLVNIGYLMPHFIKKWVTEIEPRWGQEYLSIIPQHYFMNLSTIRFYALEFKIPSKVEEYLVYRYGKDWRIPKKDWIGANEDRAIFKNDGTNI